MSIESLDSIDLPKAVVFGEYNREAMEMACASLNEDCILIAIEGTPVLKGLLSDVYPTFVVFTSIIGVMTDPVLDHPEEYPMVFDSALIGKSECPAEWSSRYAFFEACLSADRIVFLEGVTPIPKPYRRLAGISRRPITIVNTHTYEVTTDLVGGKE
jgi:hypothetical protein